jgi:hypothetical protein
MTTSFAVTLLCSGCVLPIPSRTTVRQGLSGRVVDSRSIKPIAGASISVQYVTHNCSAGTQTATTDSFGRFRIPGDHQYHWGYLIGIALNYPLPYPRRLGEPDLPASLTISHPRYQLLEYAFPAIPRRNLNYSTPRTEQNKTYRLTPKLMRSQYP